MTIPGLHISVVLAWQFLFLGRKPAGLELLGATIVLGACLTLGLLKQRVAALEDYAEEETGTSMSSRR